MDVKINYSFIQKLTQGLSLSLHCTLFAITTQHNNSILYLILYFNRSSSYLTSYTDRSKLEKIFTKITFSKNNESTLHQISFFIHDHAP